MKDTVSRFLVIVPPEQGDELLPHDLASRRFFGRGDAAPDALRVAFHEALVPFYIFESELGLVLDLQQLAEVLSDNIPLLKGQFQLVPCSFKRFVMTRLASKTAVVCSA